MMILHTFVLIFVSSLVGFNLNKKSINKVSEDNNIPGFNACSRMNDQWNFFDEIASSYPYYFDIVCLFNISALMLFFFFFSY